MKKRCKNCGMELPEDSDFCQYCGSGDIEEVLPEPVVEKITYDIKPTVFKRCIDCGRELPEDSDFCQYCGSKRVAVVNNAPEPKKTEIATVRDKFKWPFVIACIVAVCACVGTGYYYNKYTETYASLNQCISEKESVQSKLNTANRNLENYKKKASNYDDVYRYAAYSNGYSDFYARQTLLRKPSNQKVWIYFGHYNTNVYFQASSSQVKAEWGNFSGSWAPITVTYTGKGVEYLKLTNDANSEVIYITIVGN